MSLNLKGLKITWLGFLLSLIAAVISGIGAPRSTGTVEVTTSAGSVIGGIVSIISLILIIVGLSMIKDISDHYRKARNYEIIQVIVAVVFVALVSGLVVARLTSGNVAGMGAGLAVLCIIMVVILAIFTILFYRHLLQGCEETANRVNDRTLAEKTQKLWKLFIVGLAIAIVGAIILFIGLGVTMSHIIVSADSTLLAATAFMKGMLPGGIILIVGSIIMLVFTILLLVRMAQLCAYDAKRIERQQSNDGNDAENI